MRVCSEVSCGCSDIDCYTVSVFRDLYIFTDESTNKQYSYTKDVLAEKIKLKSVTINGQNLNKSSIEKLKNQYEGLV